MTLRAHTPEVFYSDDEIITVDWFQISQLKSAAAASPRKRARICAHRNSSAELHEMLIVMHETTYIQPHYHRAKPESFTVLEGEADVVLFREDGSILQKIRLGAPNLGLAFYYRLDRPVYHTVVVRSPWFVFKEVTSGPFSPSDTIRASWAPEEIHEDLCRNYQREIKGYAAAIS